MTRCHHRQQAPARLQSRCAAACLSSIAISITDAGQTPAGGCASHAGHALACPPCLSDRWYLTDAIVGQGCGGITGRMPSTSPLYTSMRRSVCSSACHWGSMLSKMSCLQVTCWSLAASACALVIRSAKGRPIPWCLASTDSATRSQLQARGVRLYEASHRRPSTPTAACRTISVLGDLSRSVPPAPSLCALMLGLDHRVQLLTVWY